MQYIQLNDEQVNRFYALDFEKENFKKERNENWNLLRNEYVVFKHEESILGACRYDGSKLEKISSITLGDGKERFSPLNIEQQCYFDLLNRQDIPIKIVAGKAGSGKTKAALKFGFDFLSKTSNPIQKIFLVREPLGMGEKIGYLKGDKDEKIMRWNNPAKDNFEPTEMQHSFEELVEKGIIELDIPSMMPGRDIKNAWIVVDEAQNLTKQQFRMIGERAALGSQVVFIGDLKQTVNEQLNYENGLARGLELEGQSPLMAVVRLIEDVRSPVSKFFADVF